MRAKSVPEMAAVRCQSGRKPEFPRWLAEPSPFAMMRAAAERLPLVRASMGAPVAELVDAPDSKSGGFTSVLVRVRPGAPSQMCKIPIPTPNPRFPQNFKQAPLLGVDDLETPSAAMRSRQDPQRLGRSGSPERLVTRAVRVLFPNGVIADRVLWHRHRAAQP